MDSPTASADEADGYLVTVPEGPHVVKVTATGQDFLTIDLIDPHRGFRALGWNGPGGEVLVVASPPGQWLLLIHLGSSDGADPGCSGGEGRPVLYTFTLTVEPRDYLALIDRPPASLQTLDVSFADGRATVIELHGDWRGDADFSATWLRGERLDGSVCGFTAFEERGLAGPAALAVAGRTLLDPGLSAFQHGTYGSSDGAGLARLQMAVASSGTIAHRLLVAWNGADSVPVRFPGGLLTEKRAHEFPAHLAARAGDAVTLVGARLDLELEGPEIYLSLDPGARDAALSSPLLLTLPGQAPRAVEGPVVFSGDEAPPGLWRIEAERYVGSHGPMLRVASLPFAVPAEATPCDG
ncbi:MAG TPA: hypothetical protein VNZ52_17150 [Candidatus Thermoplasmatota archaeon]|nr:hypothetical protein [Candidatus Thermoplasmatota archaeon]